MLSLKLTDIKHFMNQLLRSDTFDHFLLQEAVITNGASFTIDGHIHTDFYSEEEVEEHHLAGCSALPFSMLRGCCFDLIKGKKPPTSFQFIFLLSPQNLEKTLLSLQSSYSSHDINGMYINLRYQNQLLTMTTGISYAIFTQDKTLEHEWDRLAARFLQQHDIAYEEL